MRSLSWLLKPDAKPVDPSIMMSELSPVVLGVMLIMLGLGFSAAALTALRVATRIKPTGKLTSGLPAPYASSSRQEAVLLVQFGGRVLYINQAARELFNVWDEQPNLEGLARRIRPSEAFLTLCASEGQTSFSLNGRYVEASSYFVPSTEALGQHQQHTMLVTLRRPQLVLESSSPLVSLQRSEGQASELELATGTLSPQALQIFTELNQEMAASLDLEATLRKILESVEKLLPSDLLEICIWDAEGKTLTPYRLSGWPGADRQLEQASVRYPSDTDYSSYLIQRSQPLLVKDVSTFREAWPSFDRTRYPFQSYAGTPLLIAGKPIGTLELAALAKEFYSENDLEVLRLLSGQAAIALNNALLYKQEVHRSSEMAGLARLAQTVSAIRDPLDLFTRLVESISPLIPVQILGFLVYDESRHTLQGQTPFLGIQSSVVEWFQSAIEPESLADRILQSGELILTEEAGEDARLISLGLHHFALAASIHQAVLVPLTAAGRTLGYMLAAQKRDGSAFDQNDLRFLSIIAAQAAPIIDNASLVQQARQRAQRAETLRRIASLTGSNATLEEILRYSLQDLARLLQADAAAIFMLDQDRGELRLHRGSAFGISNTLVSRLGHIPANSPEFANSVTAKRQQLLTGDLLEEIENIPLFRPLVDELQIRSVIDVPLIVREQSIGELMLGALRPHFFLRGDVQTVATAASQLAAAIEKDSLAQQTDLNLRQRVEQMTAITRVSRELNNTLDLRRLLQRVYEEALRATHADCGTVLLFSWEHYQVGQGDMPGENGRQPKIKLRLGDDSGETLHPLERSVLDRGESLVIEDFEARNSAQPDLVPAHDGVRSALIVPIAYQGQIAGLIHLHARQPRNFGGAEREIGEALAIQTASAVGNVIRYQQEQQNGELLKRRVETLSKILELSHILQTDQPLESALQAVAEAIQASTSFQAVLISLYDPQANQLIRVANAGIPEEVMAELRQHPQPWRGIQALMDEKFQTGRAFFIPHEQASFVPPEVHTLHTLPGDDRPEDAHRWHSDDILFIPLFDTSGEPLGLISVDAPKDHLRPDRSTIETLEIFSNQAALVIESQQNVLRLNNQLDAVQLQLEQARNQATELQSRLPELQQKDLQQEQLIHQLAQRARRIQAGLKIAKSIAEQTSSSELLHNLGRELHTGLEFDVVLIAVPTPGGLSLLHSFGAIPPQVNPKALLGQRNPLRQCLQNGEILVIPDLDESLEWRASPLLKALDAQSLVCLPVLESPDYLSSDDPSRTRHLPLAAILGIYCAPSAGLAGEDDQLFQLLTLQTAAAMRNLNLLEIASHRLREVNLLRDFSQQLSSLDPANILHTLVESALNAVPSAQSAMVALWDENQGCLITQEAIGYARDAEMLMLRYRPGEGIPGQIFEQRQAVNFEEVDFAVHHNLSQENLYHFRNATANQFPVSSLAVPVMAGVFTPGESPSRVARPLGVLVLDNAYLTAAFTEGDLAMVTSLAQQTALILENARLYQASQQRSGQLQSLTKASIQISSLLQKDILISSLLDQLAMILPFDTATLWLLKQDQIARSAGRAVERLEIFAARGFADSDQRLGLTVDIQDSRLMQEMIQTGQPIHVADVRADVRFRTLSLEDEWEDELQEEQGGRSSAFQYLSWLGIPLISGGSVIGVIALEKKEPYFYSDDDIQVAATFAAQAAAGLENAELYQESVSRAIELDQRSRTLSILNRLSNELSGSLDADRILSYAVQELLQIIPCTATSALMVSGQLELDRPHDDEFATSQGDRSSVFSLRAEYPLDPEAQTAYPIGSIIPNTEVFDRIKETLGIFSTEDVSWEPDLSPLTEFLAYHRTQSLLIVPIVSRAAPADEQGITDQFHGLLLVHNEKLHHYEPEEVELARTISNQIAIALQNARLFEETRNLTETLEERVRQRTAELEREHQRSDTLLRIITELSASLDLDQVLNRTLGVLGEYVDADQLVVLIFRPDEPQLSRLASIRRKLQGESTEGMSDVEQQLANWIIEQRQSVLIDDVWTDERWKRLIIGGDNHPNFRSTLGVPLMSGAEALGCLLMLHTEPRHFSLDQLDLVQAAANQVSLSVNNAELYRLIRDQAEDLGGMLRIQQIETSRSKAILEAVADGVLVTDANRVITLFNQSAADILGLSREQVLGESMEHFAGMFGRATRSWLEKINIWSQDPASYQPGDSYSEQISLEDGRVISVHLAPVTLRNDFLGTVSIFQDITHQVEIDRLKSEFVATVSHELRTPITSIKGYVEILLMGAAGKLNQQQKHFLQIVKGNTDRLTILVNDLLDISKIESGKSMLSMQPMNIAEVAEQALSDLQRRIQDDQKNITIEKIIPSNLPPILGDRERVRRIFDNLLDNAFLYNLPNGLIRLRIQRIDGELQVDVKDTGLGIDPQEKERVFERFYRGESPLVLGVAGTGLGLSIVMNLVKMHNGRIWLESSGKPGEGTTFSFTLPIYHPAEKEKDLN